MAFRFFIAAPAGRILTGGVVLGTAAFASNGHTVRFDAKDEPTYSPAEVQFHTSSIHPIPGGWKGHEFKIRNDYPTYDNPTIKRASRSDLPTLPGPSVPPPTMDPFRDAPWLKIDFREDPLRYCAYVKEYCWEGNVNNEFVVQKNTVVPESGVGILIC